MKRILSIIFVCLLCCTCAIADTVVIDLDNTSIEELQAVRALIDRRIAEMSDIADEPDASYILSGTGTDIRNIDVTLAPLSRVVFTCADGDAKYTITVNGEDQKWLSAAGYFESATAISRIMVQAQDPWTIDVSPIGFIDTPFISGSGNYVSDRFTISSPSIIRVTFDYTAGGGNYWNESCSLVLYTIDSKGAVHTDYLISSEQVYEGKTITVDAIVDVDDDIQHCFWGVKCNSKIKWSISAK